MLIKFDSTAGTLTMFGDVGVQLLRMAGHSGTVPGAILAADLPVALELLEQGLRAVGDAPAIDADDPEEQPPVPLGKRAFPLISLLEAAARGGHDVLWDRA